MEGFSARRERVARERVWRWRAEDESSRKPRYGPEALCSNEDFESRSQTTGGVRMRWSLRQQLGMVAFVAIVFACAAWVGFDNGLFWAAVVCSAIMSAVFYYFARNEKHRLIVPLVPAPLLFCCTLPMASPSLMVHGVLLFVVGLIPSIWNSANAARLMTIVLAIMVVSLVVGVMLGLSATAELHALRASYPQMDLGDRLAYEHADEIATVGRQAVLPAEIDQELTEYESLAAQNSYRDHMFRQIHDRQHELFVRATGFGVTRMSRPWPGYLQRPPIRTIRYDAIPAEELHDVNEVRQWSAMWYAGEDSDVEHLHQASRNDFLDPEGFGAAEEDSAMRIGFVEHAFHYTPLSAMRDAERWTIQRLELVSLLKFDEPRVYVLDHLPRMDELSSDDVPTRALDAFEANALEALWQTKDIVFDEDGAEYRMLGSLRAATKCLECHAAARGDLLGAFSYALVRTDP